jgi:hypothetical protein
LGEVDDVVERPHLTAVGVAGELQIDAPRCCFCHLDGLMRQQNGRPTWAYAAERAVEVRRIVA